MKKSLIALAALAATGAFAQSSVSLYGRLDVGVANQVDSQNIGNVSTDAKKNGVTSHNSVSSYWGIMGTEDLGGGLKANFKLESDLFVATGVTGNSGADSGFAANNPNTTAATTSLTSSTATNGTFNRISLVSLSGNFGTIGLGRDYLPTFSLASATDAMGQSYLTTVGQAAAVGSTVDRQIVYTSPSFGGFVAKIAYANTDASIASTPGNSRDAVARYSNATGIYTNGPLMVGLGLGTRELITGAQGAVGTSTKTDAQLLAGSYDFGSFKLMGNYITAKTSASNLAGDSRYTETNVSVSIPSGAWNFIAQLGNNKTTTDQGGNTAGDANGTDWALGAEYALSKRTTAFVKTGITNKLDGVLNLTATTSLTGVAAAGVGDIKRTVSSVGIRHTF